MARSGDINTANSHGAMKRPASNKAPITSPIRTAKKVAVIVPAARSRVDRSRPQCPAFTRDFGSAAWQEREAWTLNDAMTKGNEHIHSHRARDQAAHTVHQAREDALTNEERALIHDLGGRDAPYAEKSGVRAAPAGRAWQQIREAKERNEEERRGLA